MAGMVEEKRRQLVAALFPEGIPRLWCPPITQYGADGRLDPQRTRKHLRFLCRTVRTFLLFGSTGDGWELSDTEKKEMLLFYAGEARQLGFRMLIGVLEPNKGAAAREMGKWVAWMQETTGKKDATEAMAQLHVCGFTVCPPKGAGLSQQEIGQELEGMLRLGYPTVLYQLPQITCNEMEPLTVQGLAQGYPNFYMFKDTSGQDAVVCSGLSFGGVFFVRGAEGNYEKWSALSGGCYDGFLLSSANTFGNRLLATLEALRKGGREEAAQNSAVVADIIGKVFAATESLEGGNVFANANKCIDHILAYGEAWGEHGSPMRHCGECIPLDCLEKTYAVLRDAGEVPKQGYCMEG